MLMLHYGLMIQFCLNRKVWKWNILVFKTNVVLVELEYSEAQHNRLICCNSKSSLQPTRELVVTNLTNYFSNNCQLCVSINWSCGIFIFSESVGSHGLQKLMSCWMFGSKFLSSMWTKNKNPDPKAPNLRYEPKFQFTLKFLKTMVVLQVYLFHAPHSCTAKSACVLLYFPFQFGKKLFSMQDELVNY